MTLNHFFKKKPEQKYSKKSIPSVSCEIGYDYVIYSVTKRVTKERNVQIICKNIHWQKILYLKIIYTRHTIDSKFIYFSTSNWLLRWKVIEIIFRFYYQIYVYCKKRKVNWSLKLETFYRILIVLNNRLILRFDLTFLKICFENIRCTYFCYKIKYLLCYNFRETEKQYGQN